jgi:mRNA interferase RelE/StbE
MLNISLSKKAIKWLKDLPIKQAIQVKFKLQSMILDPFPSDAKKLKNTEDYWRADIGEYRIIYKVDVPTETLYVPLIGKRNDEEVYKKFKRMQ